ncbi:Magnesium/proton exchanger [Diplonema papillatum]|nr:Magnesium/proton exchanger [Diplonema papillatum]
MAGQLWKRVVAALGGMQALGVLAADVTLDMPPLEGSSRVSRYGTGATLFEWWPAGVDACDSAANLPAAGMWHPGVRGVVYFAALAYCCFGCALLMDVLMGSVERIVSRSAEQAPHLRRPSTPLQKPPPARSPFRLVPALALVAVSSCLPSILLSWIDTYRAMRGDPGAGRLGGPVVVGSSGFSFLMTTGVLLRSVDSVKHLSPSSLHGAGTVAWAVGLVWCGCALGWWTDGVVTVWEGSVLAGGFPLSVVCGIAACWWRREGEGDPQFVSAFASAEQIGSACSFAPPANNALRQAAELWTQYCSVACRAEPPARSDVLRFLRKTQQCLKTRASVALCRPPGKHFPGALPHSFSLPPDIQSVSGSAGSGSSATGSCGSIASGAIPKLTTTSPQDNPANPLAPPRRGGSRAPRDKEKERDAFAPGLRTFSNALTSHSNSNSNGSVESLGCLGYSSSSSLHAVLHEDLKSSSVRTCLHADNSLHSYHASACPSMDGLQGSNDAGSGKQAAVGGKRGQPPCRRQSSRKPQTPQLVSDAVAQRDSGGDGPKEPAPAGPAEELPGPPGSGCTAPAKPGVCPASPAQGGGVAAKAVLEWVSPTFQSNPGAGTVVAVLVRHGNTATAVKAGYRTMSGSAAAGIDFSPSEGFVHFEKHATRAVVSFDILNNKKNTFFSVALVSAIGGASLGRVAVAVVKIYVSSVPKLSFSYRCPPEGQIMKLAGHTMTLEIPENCGLVQLEVARSGRLDSLCKFVVSTVPVDAVPGVDFVPFAREMTMLRGQQHVTVPVMIKNTFSFRKRKTFRVDLSSFIFAEMAAPCSCEAVIVQCPEAAYFLTALSAICSEDPSAEEHTWAQQLRAAFEIEGYGAAASVLHFATFFWKVACASVPPTQHCGGWAAFAVAFVLLGAVSVAISELLILFSCVTGLHVPVTAVVFAAAGTVLPDTRAASIVGQEEGGADAALGTIAEANCAGLFMGLGVPWLAAAAYKTIEGEPFIIGGAHDLAYSIVVLLYCIVVGNALLAANRFVHGGELGGPRRKALAACFFALWATFVVLTSLKVNHSTNYSPSEETPQQVIARHKAYLGREGLHSSNVLPYLYGTLKLHKEVTSMRYIAGVSRKNCVDSDSEAADAGRDARPKTTFSSTTDAQLDLTGLLKAIMSILRREDDIRFNATGYRYFWITESSDDTAFFLKTHADELAQLDAGTFDFTTMYDQLELEELLNAVADTINEAFAAEAARLNVDAGRLPKDPPELRCKRCFTDRTKDGRLFRGLRGLHVHERLCTYVNFGE